MTTTCRSFSTTKRSRVAAIINCESIVLRVSLIVLTLVMGLLYVLQMNMVATKGYDIRALEQQKEDLQKQAMKMKLDSVEMQSVERILAQLPQHKLVQSNPDAFLSTATSAVAKAR